MTFGSLGIDPEDGATPPRLRPPRLALLAVLAAAGHRGVSREKLTALFWPDSDEERARHSLRQNLYALRTGLGRDAVRSAGSSLALDETVISADVADFRAALISGDRERAVSLARGSFLDGFYLQGASGFERWVEEERGRLNTETVAALLALATAATRANHHEAATDWWHQLTLRDPLSGRFALEYLKALAARGDRAAALAFARRHDAIVRRELQTGPDPEVLRLEAELRATSTSDVIGVESRGPIIARPPEIPPASSLASTQTMEALPATEPRPVDEDSTNLVSQGSARDAHWSLPTLSRGRRTMAFAALVGFAALTAGLAAQQLWSLHGPAPVPTIAVGLVREDGRGRLAWLESSAYRHDRDRPCARRRPRGAFELSTDRADAPGQDSAVSYAEAARRAGASELLEGQLVVLRRDTLELAMRRVELRTGIVKDAYSVRAVDRYALVDSLTQSIARGFRLKSPRGSIADATTNSPVAYRLYDEGLRAYFQGDWNAANRLMNAALREDSTFAMAAYWVVKIGKDVWDPVRHQDVSGLRPIALRLAARAPDRERLMITADLLTEDQEPRAVAVAESLTTRYPHDPRAFGVLAHVYWMSGDWARGRRG